MALKNLLKKKEEKKEESSVKKELSLHERQLARQNPPFDPDIPERNQRWFR